MSRCEMLPSSHCFFLCVLKIHALYSTEGPQGLTEPVDPHQCWVSAGALTITVMTVIVIIFTLEHQERAAAGGSRCTTSQLLATGPPRPMGWEFCSCWQHKPCREELYSAQSTRDPAPLPVPIACSHPQASRFSFIQIGWSRQRASWEGEIRLQEPPVQGFSQRVLWWPGLL